MKKNVKKMTYKELETEVKRNRILLQSAQSDKARKLINRNIACQTEMDRRLEMSR